MVDGSSSNSSAYLAYLTLSYIQIYGGDTNEVFASPYNTQLSALFDGKHAFNEIAQVLPSPRVLFRPEFLEAVGNGRDPFASELRENDTVHVTPRAPVRLYYGEADVDVFPGNAQVAAAAMRAAGAQVTAVDLGVGADHPASENLGLPAARAWFDQVAVQQ
jgi:acetyl esterase/lipase